jgi:hypothetical protein
LLHSQNSTHIYVWIKHMCRHFNEILITQSDFFLIENHYMKIEKLNKLFIRNWCSFVKCIICYKHLLFMYSPFNLCKKRRCWEIEAWKKRSVVFGNQLFSDFQIILMKCALGIDRSVDSLCKILWIYIQIGGMIFCFFVCYSIL